MREQVSCVFSNKSGQMMLATNGSLRKCARGEFTFSRAEWMKGTAGFTRPMEIVVMIPREKIRIARYSNKLLRPETAS